MIAQDEGNKYILLALGKQLPKKWAAAEARAAALGSHAEPQAWLRGGVRLSDHLGVLVVHPLQLLLHSWTGSQMLARCGVADLPLGCAKS